MHFAESCGKPGQLRPSWLRRVILFDRNWPGTEWRTAVERLAVSEHRACVILMSGVAD